MSLSSCNNSSGGGGSGGGGGGGGGPCGACKFLRRKCVAGCIFAPYFDSNQGASVFASIHKVFGASNVSKLLNNIPPHKRLDAVLTISFEAQARLHDPVYGCVAHIFAFHQQVLNLQAELSYLQAHLGSLQVTPPPPPQPMATALNFAELPTGIPAVSSQPAPAYYDLSSLFEQTVQPPPPAAAAWPMQPRRFGGAAGDLAGDDMSSSPSGALQDLTRHVMYRPEG